MDPPQTPKRSPKEVEPLTPKNRKSITEVAKTVSETLHAERDPAQRQHMILQLFNYVTLLGRAHDVSLPIPPRHLLSDDAEEDDSAYDPSVSEDDEVTTASRSGPFETQIPKMKPLGTAPAAAATAPAAAATDPAAINPAATDPATTATNPAAETAAPTKGLPAATTSVGFGALQAISQVYNKSEMETLRDRFHAQISKLSLSIKVDNKRQSVTLTAEQALELTNLFFTEIFGPKGAERLTTLIKNYTSKELGDNSARLAAKAEALSHDKGLIQPVRAFFRTYGKVQRAHGSNLSQLTHMHRLQAAMALFNHLKALRDMAKEGNDQVRGYLRNQGFTTKQGVTWASVVIASLAHQLGVTTDVLYKSTMEGENLISLTQIFGLGILPLLPQNISKRLHDIGKQKMAAVYGVLVEYVEPVVGVLQILDAWVVTPMNQGEPVSLVLKAGPNKPFLDRLEAAVREVEEAGVPDSMQLD